MINLADALRASKHSCIAFVGAGGKSSAMFQVAKELSPPVILAVTTHLAISQTSIADRWVITQAASDLPEAGAISGLRVLFTGPQDHPQKVGSVTSDTLEQLRHLAADLHCQLLVEADGSRQLPLKAPADYEPVVPPFCDLVVVVVGLSGLGKPLDERWVHRPERYAGLSGLEQGQPITIEAIARVLLHPLGGMQNIPAGARRVALLNQADIPSLQAQAKKLAGILLEKFDAVLVASLKANADPDTASAADPQPTGVLAVHQRIGGVVLAAGGARRYGAPKLLLPWKGEAIVRQVVKTALSAGLYPVVVVAGEQIADIRAAVSDLDVQLVHNPDWESGQSSSVKAGLDALPANVGGCIFLLGDQPRTPTALVSGLVEKHAASLSPIVAPLIDGQRGNPVLFDRGTFPDLMGLSGDSGGRSLFARYPVEWVPWHDAGVLLDVDTPQDYQRLQDEA
jgi:molybdenum cofactor cytidylyltransferase